MRAAAAAHWGFVNATTSSSAKALDNPAHDLGLELLRYTVRNPQEIRLVLDEIAAAELGAINVLASPMFNQGRAGGGSRSHLTQPAFPPAYSWPRTQRPREVCSATAHA